MFTQTSIEAHKQQSPSNKPAGRIGPTRGFLILAARLSTREQFEAGFSERMEDDFVGNLKQHIWKILPLQIARTILVAELSAVGFRR
jgi:hypothetical protein